MCAAIGVTNQRETTLVWDKETGEPLYNAIGNASISYASFPLVLAHSRHSSPYGGSACCVRPICVAVT